MHGRLMLLHELRYGFDQNRFHLRVDVFADAIQELRDAEFRIAFRAEYELRVVVRFEGGRVTGYLVESRDLCLLGPDDVVKVAFDRILEISVAKEMFFLANQKTISLGVALWEGGLPMDLLPGEGMLEIQLGEENYAWKLE